MLTRDPRTRQQGLPYRIRRCWLPRATWRRLVQARIELASLTTRERCSRSWIGVYFSTLAAFQRAFLAIFAALLAGLNVPLAFREPSGIARTYHGRRNVWLRERARASIPFDSMRYLQRPVERFKSRAIGGTLEIVVDEACADWVA